MRKISEKIKNLPQTPGVYIFRGLKREILYIGKATSLRNRVGSYFRNYNSNQPIDSNLQMGNRPVERMIHRVSDIEFFETDSVLEALILESNLIKKHQPKYNIDLKDDKSFSYFAITKEEFPKVLIFRKTDISEKKLEAKSYKLKAVFGPYTSKKQMEIALKIIRKIFPFHSLKAKTEKGCLDFQLGMCPGPYAGAISKEDYVKNIRAIKMILEGKKKNLVKSLEKEMKTASEKEEFEKAAEIRNKIYALNHIRDIALMGREFYSESTVRGQLSNVLRIEAYDISNISGKNAVGSMVVFENGKPNKSEYRKFKIKFVKGIDDVAMMREVLARRFSNDWTKPDLILLDGGIGHFNMAKKLFESLDIQIPFVSVAKGLTRKNLKIQISNSKQITNYKLQIAKNTKTSADQKIQEILEDKNLIKRIMDEAHRFAIGFHRKIRRKGFLE